MQQVIEFMVTKQMLHKKMSNLNMEIIEADGVILTVNNRLANFLHKTYAKYQKEKGKHAWETPSIYPFTTWLEILWKQSKLSSHYLLTDFQEKLIWQDIIATTLSDSLINLDATAELAQQAWQMINLWNLSIDAILPSDNKEISTFIHLTRQFQERCSQHNWLSRSRLPHHLLNLFRQSPVSLPKDIQLIGFDELPPIYQQFFSCLEKFCNVTILSIHKTKQHMQRIELVNQHTEILTMARWTKKILEQNPSHKIGCIIPNLNKIRSQVEQVFFEVFISVNALSSSSCVESPFNFSAGYSLTHYEMIRMALSVLEISTGQLELKKIGELLQSPYINSSETDINLSALLNVKLRQYRMPSLPLSALLSSFSHFIAHYPQNTLLKRWRTFTQITNQIPKIDLPSQWAKYFIRCLNTIGWPGYRTLSRLEYQLFHRWEKLLFEFATLDPLLQNISLSKSLSILQSLCNQTIFQAESKETPIQILGTLEATGYPFDALWVMGLHDEVWPPPARPNPFLPFTLQVQQKMPHASAERELDFTQQIQQRLLHSANEIVISSPYQEKDRLLRPSPLIKYIKKITLSDLNLPEFKSYSRQMFLSQEIENISDHQAPKINEQETIQGGSWILKQQSACPFRAFATYRLNAYSLTPISFTITPTDRGILVHKILERIWLELKDHTTLCQQNEVQLQQLITNTVKTVITELISQGFSYPNETILTIEKNRLSKLILEWLKFEKNRIPFAVVQRETKRLITIGCLKLNIQIDRIDELPDGSHIIIDYKTSTANINEWFGDRPKEPQLPIYCIYGADNNLTNYVGITFAEVCPSQMKFKGLTKEISGHFKPPHGLIPINRLSLPTEFFHWQSLINHWKITIDTLAEQFHQGIATVDPIHSNTTCATCELQPLCRIKSHE